MQLSSILGVIALSAILFGCEASEPPTGTPAFVQQILFDPETGSPVLILREREGPRSLPIWIGMNEARSIASRMEGERPPRPNTHDLAKRLIDRLAGTVRRIVVTRLHGGVYFARIHLSMGDEQFEVDARPSDAIALALRFDAPIFVHESLFEMGDATDRQVPSLRL
ncbi:MAG: bifunctional nuclease family protein [Deltaproteobacteria bacterium]|nr:bifunctional nuclease family protein [Deltaproteobacteria bacterium]MBW2393359.1 bifunctional nuclease family protein [Deltaproteobacteria bacterium]